MSQGKKKKSELMGLKLNSKPLEVRERTIDIAVLADSEVDLGAAKQQENLNMMH